VTDMGLKQENDPAELHAEICERIPLGLMVLHFSDSRDEASARILEINSGALKCLGATEGSLRGKAVSELPEFRPFLRHFVEVLETGARREIGEISRQGAAPSPQIYSLQAFPLPGNCVGVTLEDVTATRAVARDLREGEERFRFLVRGVKDYAIFILDRDGYILSWNEGAETLKGYREDEIVGKHFSQFYLPEDVQAGKPQAKLLEVAQKGKAEDEGWRVRKDGSRFWANVVITALRDNEGKLCGFVKITRDVAERRQREEALREANVQLELRLKQRADELLKVNEQLRAEVRERERVQEQYRALAIRQQKVREEERTHVAREMHDELGQLCTALKMDLVWIAQRLPQEQSRLRERTSSALTLVGDLIQSLRRLSAELRPSTLDSLGLVAALQWQAQEFQTRTGILCQVDLPEKEVLTDQDRSTAIFRIFQETLTNVARHANATAVQASLVLGKHRLALVVHDNGKGFDASFALKRGSPGLLGMSERAHLIGGDLKVSSAPGSGTTVTVHVPLGDPRSGDSHAGPHRG
jgi:PAS domain S-box-containing protein